MDQARGKRFDMSIKDLFCFREPFDVAKHDLVDGGIDVPQEGHELQPDAVAAGFGLRVGVVVDVFKSVGFDIAVYVGAAETEHGMDHMTRTGTDAMQTGDAGASE